jgi:hypothetical protein
MSIVRSTFCDTLGFHSDEDFDCDVLGYDPV